jgi:hypothetical protein
VVVSANFLIDSESQLRAALSNLSAGDAQPDCAPTSYRARGVFEAHDAAAGTVTLSHQPIPELNWPEMTMDFGLATRHWWPASCPAPRCAFLVLLGTLFLIVGGLYAVKNTPLDALPDLSDVQVIVYTEFPGQAPQVVEDQVTYPLTTAMLAVPKSKVVRGFSFFGASFVYVIFEDGTDIYWARSRVLEYLNFAAGRCPPACAADRPRRHRRRLGLPVRAAGQEHVARRTAQPAGLVCALPAHQGARAWPRWQRRRLRAQYQVTVDPHRLRATASR